MLRYLRLYVRFVRFSFSRAMEFRLDFFFRVGMDALWYAVNLAFFWVVYGHTRLLGGWSYEQVLVFATGYFFVDAVQMTVFSNNAFWFPVFVNRGDLDYYLVRPVSSLFFLSLRDFAANSFLNLVLAVGLLAWALANYPGRLGAAAVAMYVVLLLVGVFLHYVLSMLFMIPVFWTHTSGGLREIFWALDRYAHKPHRIFSGLVFRVLVTALPFALIASFPTMVLFEGLTLPLFLHMAAVPALLFALMLLLWRAGLRSYTSASS
ncbi:MAG: ABC transporter permease [Planctomycetota bacterium]